MDSAFWLGLAASIPIGFAVNLLTPAIERFLQRREAKISHQVPRRLLEDLAQMREFSEDPVKYEDYRFVQLMRTTIVAAIGGILSSLFFSIPNFIDTFNTYQLGYLFDGPYKKIVTGVAYILGNLIAVITGLIVVNIARNSLRVMRWVRNYPEYERRVRKLLGEGGEVAP